jgi:hypothetical protein
MPPLPSHVSACVLDSPHLAAALEVVDPGRRAEDEGPGVLEHDPEDQRPTLRAPALDDELAVEIAHVLVDHVMLPEWGSYKSWLKWSLAGACDR